MKTAKLAPALLVLLLAIASLACPTRPIDSSGTGGAAGVATPGGGGAAGSGVAGAAAAGGTGDGTGGASVGGHTGAAGATGDIAGSGTGGVGGVAGSAAGATGAAGGAAGAGGVAGAAGGPAGAGGGAAGSAGARDGQPCSLAADCASRVCTGFYVDVDGDGYGAGQPVGFCGTTAPIGYASMNGDCCDDATNIAVAKLIHPGADFQTTSAGGVCGITWDYDCSGTVETNPQIEACAGTYPQCSTAINNRDPSTCGMSADQGCSCTGAGNGTNGICQLACVGHPSVTIGCK